jgi:hypothetical protein
LTYVGKETPIERTPHGRDSNPPCLVCIPEEYEAEWEIFKQQSTKIPHMMHLEGIEARANFWTYREDY